MIPGPWAEDQEPCRAAVGLLKRLHEQLKSMTFGRKCPGGLGAPQRGGTFCSFRTCAACPGCHRDCPTPAVLSVPFGTEPRPMGAALDQVIFPNEECTEPRRQAVRQCPI